MSNKRIQLYASDDVIKEFYEALLSGEPNRISRVHIPKSDVFYVRKAIEENTGVKYTLDHVERAMYLEGMIDRKDVLDPNRKRDGVG
jgi:rRNA processing protein Krr1/Pno1